jgi:hypothetical protein
MSALRYESRSSSLRKAINGYCRQCIYDSADAGTWRQQVTLCTSTECSLYPVRPLSQDADILLDVPRGPHQTVKQVLREVRCESRVCVS